MRIDLRGLRVRYGRRPAVRGIDLTARPGEVLAVLGPNGSGKSSVLRALAGLVPYDGVVDWDEARGPPRGGVGFMAQDNAIRTTLTVFEVVLLGRIRSLSLRVHRRDQDAAAAVLTELGIAGLASRRIGTLSGGQRQMVFLAQVLAGDPRVLLLDEPTSALDIAHQIQVLDLLRTVTRRRALTTIMVLHDLHAAARYADSVALLADGSLLGCGRPDVVLTPVLLRAAFGVEVVIVKGPDGCRLPVPVSVAPGLDQCFLSALSRC